MSKIALVTDSTCNMPEDLLAKERITMVPVYVMFGEESFKEYVELPPPEFYRRLIEQRAAGKGMPTSSQPTPEDFRAAYSRLAGEGFTDIISVHVTAKSSGTCQSAELARTMVEGVNVHVVDSATTSMQMGFMLMAARKVIDQGGSVEDALAAIDRVKTHSSLFFTVTDVEHLSASGRTKGHKEVAEAAISVKPIVTVADGVPTAIGKERTQRAALRKVLEMTRQKIGDHKVKHLAVVNGNIQEKAERWAVEAASELGFEGEPWVVDFGPGLAVHFGPGLLGVTVEWE